MSNWNISRLRKIAGLSTLNESWDRDDDDDEDPDVKIASGDKRQQAFEKKNKPELDAAKKAMADKTKAQKEAAAKKKAEAASAKPAEKKEAPKAAPKEEPKAEKKEDDKPAEKKEEPKSETPAAEAKRRGAKPNENSKSQRAAAWIKANPSAKRGAFLAWARENLEMGAAYGSAFFARHNPKSSRQQQQANECWVLVHPSMPSFLLAENREMNRMQWVDPGSPMEPMMFTSLADANKTAKYMSEWKSQYTTVEHIVFED